MDGQTIMGGVFIGIAIAVGINIFIRIMKHWLIIGTASKIGVIAGMSGYSLVRVGQAGISIPFINKTSWLDISAIVEEIKVENVISKGGTPVSINAMAIYGIGSSNYENENRVIGNAIKTSLSKSKEQVSKQISEILEANFRETIVGMTPEELINDKKQFNDRIMKNSKDDLEVLGFRLYDVKIKDIWDDKGYLKTLTKKGVQKMTAQMDVLEKECDSEAAKKEAENKRQIEVSTANMNQTILEREKQLELLRREKQGKSEEAKKVARQKIEKSQAEGMGKIRKASIEVERIAQTMEMSLPAEFHKRCEEIVSQGDAEKTRIIGEAINQILNEKLKLFGQSGREGLIPFLLSRLHVLAESYKECLKDIRVDKATILGTRDGESAYAVAANMGPSAFKRHLQNLEDTFGLSLKQILKGSDARGKEARHE
ncbi:MAG: hypothetical protein JW774_09055 [Candidatus Aureabacteria bacterium]|nr:hypothetical protein [Candidatus Auribacterota bacterium]